MGVGGIGALFHGDAAGGKALLVASGFDKRIAEVEVGIACAPG